METSLTRIAGPASLADDPDWSVPSNEEPTADRQISLEWYLAGPVHQSTQARMLLVGVTFRDADHVEQTGTFDMDFFWVFKPALSAESSTARASWKKIGTVTAQNSHVPVLLDVGGAGTLAVRLYNMSAGTATTVHLAAQQWGAG